MTTAPLNATTTWAAQTTSPPTTLQPYFSPFYDVRYPPPRPYYAVQPVIATVRLVRPKSAISSRSLSSTNNNNSCYSMSQQSPQTDSPPSELSSRVSTPAPLSIVCREYDLQYKPTVVLFNISLLFVIYIDDGISLLSQT